jgi:hypothetical protein
VGYHAVGGTSGFYPSSRQTPRDAALATGRRSPEGEIVKNGILTGR